MIKSEWVKLCPYLELDPPNPLASDFKEKTKDLMKVYEFFKERNPQNFMHDFLKHYTKLPQRTKSGESKIEQVMKSINLIKIAQKLKTDIDAKDIDLKESRFAKAVKDTEDKNASFIKQAEHKVWTD